MAARRTVTWIAGGAALVAAIGVVVLVFLRPPVPSRDPLVHDQVVRAFYRGLASLDVGLLDAAVTEFTRVTELAPDEPAAWANLGLTYLRRSEFDAAAQALQQAATRAPNAGDIAMLQGALDGARGAFDASVEHLERAVASAPDSLRARWALAAALERTSGAVADARLPQLHDEMLALQPENLVLLVDRARLAARRADVPTLDDSVSRLEALSGDWPPAATEQLAALRRAVAARDATAAGRDLAFLRNVLARVPAFRDHLASVSAPAGLLADPIPRFLTLPPESPVASPPDLALEYSRDTFDINSSAPVSSLLGWPLTTEGPPAIFAVAGEALLQLDAGREPRGFPGPAAGPASLLALDWNHDFRTDLLLTGASGVRLLLQDAGGALADGTPRATPAIDTGRPAFASWTADLDMDGDLDVVVGLVNSDPLVLRNNADGTWRGLPLFTNVGEVREFAWGDIDRDGDPDAVLLDVDGDVHLFLNQQAGRFQFVPSPPSTRGILALTIGDIDGNGTLDLITVDRSGVIQRASIAREGWDERQMATVSTNDSLSQTAVGASRLRLADLDNNAALDLLISTAGSTALLLADSAGAFQPLPPLAGVNVHGILDLNADGLLDLLGIAGGRPVRMLARGQRGYHWQVVRTRAQTAAGDQRINSSGVGGEIEVRSGTLVQKRLLNGAPIHVGLGTRNRIDVARIVWPNGVMQAEFELQVDRPVIAEQRLKGSCPWLFAYDGRAMSFVTDVLWRSPLGLRINAQDTAGTTQTEDWVAVRAEQLVPRDGQYDLRIAAELWETHFFDHVSLIAVDHPADVAVFVDERFAREAPSHDIRAMTDLTPAARAWDDAGGDVTALLRAADGQHVGGFDKGAYQGLAREHALTFDLPEHQMAASDLWLIARGWVYPTDSSINVAIAQGQREPPRGLALDWQDPAGAWHPIHRDLGFPAGKNKTMLIDLSTRPRGARRLRLRTNMEIYWDWFATARPAPTAQVLTTRLAATSADLRYRGYSVTNEDTLAHAPETPIYAALANTAPRWRDLEGYHTRFGDVTELVSRVDDRYVIMNAGDELRLTFPAPPPTPGRTRDFIFISDGWEKDGDFNTDYSKTVLPLPSHARDRYVAASPSLELEDDPVYRRHPEDWQRYHTRYVAPDRYLRGLTAR